MNPTEIKTSAYVDFGAGNNGKDPNIKIGDDVRTLKYQNIFEKACLQIFQQRIFLLRKVKSTVPWACVISDLNSEEVVGTF